VHEILLRQANVDGIRATPFTSAWTMRNNGRASKEKPHPHVFGMPVTQTGKRGGATNSCTALFTLQYEFAL